MSKAATSGSARRGEPPRRSAVVLGAVLFSLVVGCGGSRVVPEPGATLLRITSDVASPMPPPDELRVWAYDDGGRLWDGVRVPDQGALRMPSAGNYGTLLVQPGAIHGPLRLRVRALASGARVMDGVTSIAEALLGKDTIDLRLSEAVLPDVDGDDVPDIIDDCLAVANPAQGGCASALSPPDAGADGMADGAAVDEHPGDAAGSDVSSPDSAASPDSAGTDADASPSADATGDAGPAADASPGTDARPGTDASPGTDAGPATDAGPGTDATGTRDGAGDACSDACGTTPPTKAIGQACTSAGQCVSGFCADGVCCVSACGATCQSCSTGVCLPVTQAKDTPQCTGTMTCNRKGDCVAGG
jgi:hypothetical protein